MTELPRDGLPELFHGEDWLSLGLAGRRAIAQGKVGNQQIVPTVDAAILSQMLELQWIEKTGQHYAVLAKRRPMATAARFLFRNHILTEEGKPRLDNYMIQLARRDEIEALCSFGWGLGKKAGVTLTSRSWVEDFLAAQSAHKWASSYYLRTTYFAPRYDATVQVVMDLIVNRPTPWPWLELWAATRQRGLDELNVQVAVMGLMHHFLIYSDLSNEDLLPRFGLWPEVAAWRHRPPPAPLVAIPGVAAWQRAFAAENMLNLLAAASLKALEIRKSDGGLAVRQLSELQKRFSVIQIPGVEKAVSVELCMDSAKCRAEHFGLLRMESGDQQRLVPSSRAIQTLAGGVEAIVQLMAIELKKNFEQKNASGDLSRRILAAAGNYFSGSENTIPALHAALVTLDAACGSQGMVCFSAWLAAVADKNPFQDSRNSYFSRNPEENEQAWMRVLFAAIYDFLLPIGGAAVAWHEGQRMMRLTAIGRWCLGLESAWNCDLPVEKGDLLIKPDYEVVFLAPAPALEARLAGYATRLGHGVGALFRLERSPIQAAAAAGMKAEVLWEMLRKNSRHALPANVEREVTGWFAAVRRIESRSRRILDCEDVATARAVQAVAREKVVPLTATLLELLDTNDKGALLKKLAEKGIFVNKR